MPLSLSKFSSHFVLLCHLHVPWILKLTKSIFLNRKEEDNIEINVWPKHFRLYGERETNRAAGD